MKHESTQILQTSLHTGSDDLLIISKDFDVIILFFPIPPISSSSYSTDCCYFTVKWRTWTRLGSGSCTAVITADCCWVALLGALNARQTQCALEFLRASQHERGLSGAEGWRLFLPLLRCCPSVFLFLFDLDARLRRLSTRVRVHLQSKVLTHPPDWLQQCFNA